MPATGYVAAALWLSGLAALVFEPDWLAHGRVILIALFGLLSLALVSRLTQSILMVATAATLFVGLNHNDWTVAPQALEFALIFTIFLPTVLLIRETMVLAPETRRAIQAFDRLGQGQRVAGMVVGCHLLAVVLVLGGLVATAPFIQAQKDNTLKRELAVVTLRGYALCVHWSPFTIGMAYALAFRPDVSLISAMAMGLAITVLGMVIAVASARGLKGLWAIPRSLTAFSSVSGPILIAVSLVTLVSTFSALGTIQVVAVIMPVLCVARLLALGRSTLIAVGSKVASNIHRMSDELVLFMAAGAIGFAIQSSGAAEGLVEFLDLDQVGPSLMIVIVMISGPVLALIGLHPVVAASIVTAFLAPLDASLPDFVEVQLILFVWSCGAFLSFGSLSVGAASRMFEIPIQRLVISSNIGYIVMFGAVVTILLEVLTLVDSATGF